MMKHVSILILIFLACLFAGCADEPIDSPEGLPEKGIVVSWIPRHTCTARLACIT